MTGSVDLRVPTDEDAVTWTALFDDEVMRCIADGRRRDATYCAP